MTATRDQVPGSVVVSVAPALLGKLDTAMVAALADRVTAEFARITAALGLPAGVTTRVASAVDPGDADPADVTETAIRVLIDGRPLRYPETALWRALAYVRSAITAPLEASDIAAGLAALSGDELSEVVTLTCRDTAVRNADLLIAAGQPAAQAVPATADQVIELCLSAEQLNSFLAEDPLGEGFIRLRDTLAEEAGLPLPALRLRRDPSLRPGAYAFQVNGLPSVPRIGLTTEQILVLATPAQLAPYHADARPAADPVRWTSAAVAARAAIDQHEDLAFLTTRKADEYLLSDLGQTIREHADAFVTEAFTERLLDELGTVFAALAQFVRDHVPAQVLVQVLRELMRDQIPSRDLRRIAELCLRFQPLAAMTPGAFVDHVRAGLADVTALRVSRGTATIVVYLLDGQLEEALAGLDPDHAAAADLPVQTGLCAALRAELAHLPLAALQPALLTSDDARRAARRLLRSRFPRMDVIGYSDVPEQVNIQPVARLSAPEPLPAG